VGGASVPEELIKKFAEYSGANVVEGWGLTESTSGLTADLYYHRTGLGAGFLVPYVDIRIIDPNTGEDVPIGKEGEVLLKGPTISPGYWEKPEETARTFQDGWLHTGDIMRMTEEGALQFVDRLKEIIIVSGFNVYPTEVENVLYEHPSIFEAAVIGYPDERQGESVKAVIALKPGSTVEKQEIINFCRERLMPYKVPKIVEFIEQLPKNPTGKILKKELR
jgi:long-chain acyl-CoA synthetase